MNKEITSEKNYKFRQVLKKNIPSKYKRHSSLENKNLRIRKRSDSNKLEEAINHNTFVNKKNSNAKSSLDVLLTNKSPNKRFSPKNKIINRFTKKENNIQEKRFNNTNIIMIIDNKEKAKTFNRHASPQKLKLITSNKPNNYFLLNNKKNNNLLRVKSGAFKLDKNKLLSNKMSSNDNINDIEKTDINNNMIKKSEKNNNTKRNTDIIIQIKNKKNTEKKRKEKNNFLKNENIQNKINKKIFNNKNSDKIQIKRQKSEDNLKKELLTSNQNDIKKYKIISPISIINNNNSNEICNTKKTNYNFDNLLVQRKNIDINLDYQINQKCQNGQLNNTTRIKLKSNGFVTNIEMDKDKEFLHLTENNSILQSKSRPKIKHNYIIKQSDSEIKNKKIIFNNRFDEKNLPLFIRKCGSLNENKNFQFNYNKINDKKGKCSINLTENNQEKENCNLNDCAGDLEKTIDLNDNQNKNNKEILNKDENNELINKKNSLHMNVENSFTTINFYNSNIDENNNNESKNNLVNILKNYNFMSNRNNNTQNIFNIYNIFGNNNIINNNNNDNINIINHNFDISKNKLEKNKQTISQNIIVNDCKNIHNNLYVNNNFSDCNTRNTSNNNQNNKKMKETNINSLNNNQKINSLNDNQKRSNKDEINNNIPDKGKAEFNVNNIDKGKESNNRKSTKNKITNKMQIEDKDFSLDKSTSLRLFPVHEDFLEKEDEVIKLFNFQSPRDSNKENNIYPYMTNEEESEIIFQNSEYSKEISLLINNDYSKNNYIMSNKNILQNMNLNINTNFPNQNINIDNVGLKDTSIISNIGIKGCKSITQAGKERTGHRKKNQDFYIIEKNINNILGFNLFAILDGHGVNGHMVSQFASKLILKKFISITNKFNDIESIYNFLKKSDFQKIIDIFLEIDNKIMEQKGFDISLSGTTCCLVIQLYEHIICSNIGDSRGILIFDDNKIFELSHDSKPEVPEETKRINLMGGIVDQVKNEDGEKTGPYRVYIKNMELPGLAMSRSFGDKKAKSCGVIPYPDIIEYSLNNDSKYMVICSDGVWEFLSNKEVMKIGNKYYIQNNINDFCSELLKKSTEMWEMEENYIDDITIVAVFF